MKKIFLFLIIIASVLTIILSILLIYNLAIIPSILGLIFGLLAFYLLKKGNNLKKPLLIFILNVMTLVITTYKSIFNKTEITNTKTKLEKEDNEGLKKFRN